MLRLWSPRTLALASPAARAAGEYRLRIAWPALRRSASTDGLARIPLRKQLKEEAKSLKTKNRHRQGSEKSPQSDGWELTVGIEIHAQLNTAAKLFSS